MCVPEDDKVVLQGTEIAFTGEVVSLEGSSYAPHPFCWKQSTEKPKCGGRLATIKVAQWLRGTGGETVTVLKEDGCYCLGGYWEAGDKLLVVAEKNRTPSRLKGEFLAKNVCSGTGQLNEKQSALVAKFKTQPIPATIK